MTICSVERVFIASVALLLVGLQASAQQTSPQSVADAQRDLLQLTVSDSMNTDVPPLIREGVVKLKRALAAETDAVVLRLSDATTATAARQHLMKVLPSPAIGKIASDQRQRWAESDFKAPSPGLYGGELTIFVKKLTPSLLLVRETFDIACGSDNVLLVYSNAGGAWKRVLLWQSKPYSTVGEAFGDTYETLLLRPQHNGHPLLLVLHGTPWCTSVMSRFSMDVLELGDSPNSAPLWHGGHDYRIDSEPPLTLRATVNGFEVRASVSTTGERVDRKGVSYAVVARKGLMRYAVDADGIHRVEPIAMNAHDSVEEWLEMSRSEAAEFADEPAGSLTWKMFEEFTYEGKRKTTVVPFPAVGAVRACKDSSNRFQAEVTSEIFDPAAAGSRPGPTYFVQIMQVANGYRIEAVTIKKKPICDGPDLMAP